jgi:methylthioribose-1-phosphate isomerase
MEDTINTLKTQVELLKQTDVNIVSGLNDIKSLLRDMHNDNKSFQERTHDRVTRLEYDSEEHKKKIKDVQAKAIITDNNVINISTTIIKLKSWALGYGAGAGITGGAITYVLFKVMGFLH